MLDDRKSAILRAVVQTYIETAQPVGSSHVVEATDIGVSPATVRNDMTLLEHEGYITQPHTSAGRIPTEKGYRFFVDHLGPGELGAAQSRQVRAFFAHAHGELEAMLQSTSKLLSKVTSTTALVVAETGETSRVRSVQLVGLSPSMFLVVAVLSSGSVLKKTIERSAPVGDDDLADATAHLMAGLSDHRISEIPEIGPSGNAVVDELVGESLDALRSSLHDDGRKVFVEGASNLAGALDASSQLVEVLGLLEQQITVVSLIRDVLDRGLTVAIGSETGVAPLAECALVVRPYMVGGEPAGTIGVLGPTRMNYPEMLAAVAVVSDRLSKQLTEG